MQWARSMRYYFPGYHISFRPEWLPRPSANEDGSDEAGMIAGMTEGTPPKRRRQHYRAVEP